MSPAWGASTRNGLQNATEAGDEAASTSHAGVLPGGKPKRHCGQGRPRGISSGPRSGPTEIRARGAPRASVRTNMHLPAPRLPKRPRLRANPADRLGTSRIGLVDKQIWSWNNEVSVCHPFAPIRHTLDPSLSIRREARQNWDSQICSTPQRAPQRRNGTRYRLNSAVARLFGSRAATPCPAPSCPILVCSTLRAVRPASGINFGPGVAVRCRQRFTRARPVRRPPELVAPARGKARRGEAGHLAARPSKDGTTRQHQSARDNPRQLLHKRCVAPPLSAVEGDPAVGWLPVEPCHLAEKTNDGRETPIKVGAHRPQPAGIQKRRAHRLVQATRPLSEDVLRAHQPPVVVPRPSSLNNPELAHSMCPAGTRLTPPPSIGREARPMWDSQSQLPSIT